MEKGSSQIMLTAEDGSEEVFFVVEKADIAGKSYLLVADSDQGDDVDALILSETADGDEIVYEVVEEEEELKIISRYFEELLEDIDIRVE